MIPDYNKNLIPIFSNPKNQNFERKGIVKSSIPTLTKFLGGFEKGELITITAPPGQGKTQLARTFCLDFISQGLNCLYVSYELRYNQLLGLFVVAGLGEMDSKLLILQPEDTAENDITFVEQIAGQKIDVLVVDDIHSLEEKYSLYRNTDNMALVMRGLAQRLKMIATKNNLIVITMAHTRKDAIDSKDSSLSEIAYSGGIAQVSDTVLSIKTDKKDGNAIIEVIKARWAGGKMKVKCKNVNKKFIELEPYEQTPGELFDNLHNNSFR